DNKRSSGKKTTRKVEKIIVGAVAVKIVRALGFVGCKQKDGAAVGLAGQGLAAHSIVRIGLSVESGRKLAKKEEQQQDLAHPESPGSYFQLTFLRRWLQFCLPR
ncbi:MAG: hypothetical protein ACRD72_23230, partial [Candidatus Angelobacter sp.]